MTENIRYHSIQTLSWLFIKSSNVRGGESSDKVGRQGRGFPETFKVNQLPPQKY